MVRLKASATEHLRQIEITNENMGKSPFSLATNHEVGGSSPPGQGLSEAELFLCSAIVP